MFLNLRFPIASLIVLAVAGCSGVGPTATPLSSAQPTGSPVTNPTVAISATPSPSLGATPTAATTASMSPEPTASPSAVPSPSPSPSAAAAPIELVAGGGTETPAAGVVASAARLIRPTGVAVAPDGTVWIVDASNVLIHIGLDGKISELAGGLTNPEGVAVGPDAKAYAADRGAYRIATPNGNGGTATFAGIQFIAGFNGDGRLAKKTRLWLPYDVATDGAGDVYIADTGNARIRVVDSETLKVQTIAGTGTSGFAGDDGPALDAQINDSRAIAVDQGATMLLIADYGNSRVRQVDLTTGRMTTIAGTGTGAVNYSSALTGLQTPLTHLLALAVDPQGNAYVPVFYADLGLIIMHLDPTGAMTRIAGGGQLAQAGVSPLELKLPDVYGLAVDPTNGDLYICSSDGRVYRVSGAATIAGP
jgi:hypothetical protein